LQTSGTGSVADLPVSGAYVASRKFSDADVDILPYLKMREAKHPFPQRTTDVEVTRLGGELNVNTYILMSPTIYGLGTGYFNRLSIQVPFYIRAAIEMKVATVISDGSARWSNIHIEDLAAFYEFFVAKLLNGQSQAAHDAQGIYFTETGESSWLEIVQMIAHVGRGLGVLETENVESMTLEDAASKWTGGNTVFAELGFASK
jgi:nucleoside-diphosphate-sugar epimerase